MADSHIKIFSGSSNPKLAESIAKHLGQPLGSVKISRFQSGEIYVHYEESIRGTDVFLIQTFSKPINELLVETLIMVDAAKRASAKTINLVIPYYGYARQEKKDAPREPISAKMIADVFETVGVNRVVTIDLHAPAIQGFFNFPLDHLTALDIIAKHLKEKNIERPVVVSPDAGRAKTAEKLATMLDAPVSIMIKKRPAHNESAITHIIGEVENRTPIIIEDIIDTGGTIVNVVEGLKEKGALDAYICATHPVFSGDAINRLNHPNVEQVVITDSLPIDGTLSEKFTVLTVAPLLAEAIHLIQTGGSISTLFQFG